jgi:cell division protein FtsB
MSVEQTEIIEGIRLKIQSVKSMLQQQKDENNQLKKQNEDLQQKVQQKQSMIEELGREKPKTGSGEKVSWPTARDAMMPGYG